MGTKIEYAISPLASSSSSNRSSFLLHRVNDRDNYPETRELKKVDRTQLRLDDSLGESMDRMLEKHNKESIKRTMQLHEQVFKHQVKELHRLYSVQRMLMEELKKELKQTRIRSNTLMLNSDIINPSLKYINKQHYHLTTQCTSPSSKGFDLERPIAVEEISNNIKDQEAGTSNKMRIDDDESEEIELTLSIGFSSSSNSNKKSSKNGKQQKPAGISRVKEIGGYTNEIDSAGASSFKLEIGGDECSSSSADQENKRPHWLLQSLSINRS